MHAGQTAEQQRLIGHELLHVGDHGIHVIGNERLVVGVHAAEDVIGHIIEDGADLREVGVRRRRRGDAVRKRGRCRQKAIRAVRRCQRGQVCIAVDDAEDRDVAVMQRRFGGRDAAEGSAAIDRCGRGGDRRGESLRTV